MDLHNTAYHLKLLLLLLLLLLQAATALHTAIKANAAKAVIILAWQIDGAHTVTYAPQLHVTGHKSTPSVIASLIGQNIASINTDRTAPRIMAALKNVPWLCYFTDSFELYLYEHDSSPN
jgi:hypothetical protein